MNLLRFILFFCAINLLSCADKQQPKIQEKNPFNRDWSQIKSDSVLTVLAENSPASFFIYRGRNMGYEYELLHEFCKDQHIMLRVEMVHDLDQMLPLLQQGKGDIVACNLTKTEKREQFISFTNPHLTTHQVLVQRKPKNYRRMRYSTIKDSLITKLEGLYGKTIHVYKNSSYFQQITHLNKRLNLNLTIIPTEGDLITEELIKNVSEGKIEYTIADENVARIDLGYYPNLDVSLKLSSTEEIAFGLRKTSPVLKEKLNEWFKSKANKSTIAEVKRKYFKRKQLPAKANKIYSSLNGEKLSPYDQIIKNESKKMGWDWRLISAVIYQESKFETWKESWAGAFGIFQFMPATAESYGIDKSSSAEAQIKAGIRKLNKNFNQWLKEIKDSTECIKFTLATFNAGRGHINDGRALAREYGLKDSVWNDHVAEMVRNLSKPSYYKQDCVRHGYCRGTETYDYIIKIMQRFKEYQAAFPDTKNSSNLNH